MTCVFNTTVLLDRMCFPTGEMITSFGDSFKAALESSGASGTVNTILTDVFTGIPVIGGSVGIALLIGLIYMGFLYVFAGVIVWMVIVAFFGLVSYLAYIYYTKWQEIVQW